MCGCVCVQCSKIASQIKTILNEYVFFPNYSEQPIFTCSAHVFHIDPKTKRTWITASTKAVSVSFFYDSSRNLYRIISVEGSKAVINSTITPNMSFTQTSQKFGQWSDVRANTVYGLGFSSEAELTKFVEKFQEVKEATKNALAKTTANGKLYYTNFIKLLPPFPLPNIIKKI